MEIELELDLFLNSEDEESENASSSSSSEDELLHIAGLLKDNRVAIQKFVEEVVPMYTEQEFITHFRLGRNVFKNLSERYKLSEYFIEKGVNDLYPAVSSEKSMLLFLWFMGHQTASYRDVANQFDVSLSTMHLIVSKVSAFLCDLAPQVIQWPSADEQNETANYVYQAKGFPNVIGCIDGSHIRIDKPQSEFPDSYINRKGYHSIHLQIICNYDKKIIDIYIGYPGSVHDARVFTSSDAYELCLSLSDNSKYILGDSAYPCLESLLVPYKDNGHLTDARKRYNKKLSSCRVYVEHTIGLLKQRFRQMYHLKTRSIELLVNQIKACCVLHNLASNADIQYFEEPLENVNDVIQNIDPPEIEAEMKRRGKVLRDVICETL